MRKDINSLYAAVLYNSVVAYGFNLKDFIEVVRKIEPETKHYQHYYREFQKTDKVVLSGSEGKEYVLQKVI